MTNVEHLVKAFRELDNHAKKVLCIDAALYWNIKHFKNKATVNEKLDQELLFLKAYLSKEISDYNSYRISKGPNHLFPDNEQNLNVVILSDYFSGNASALKDIDPQFLEDRMWKLRSLISNANKTYNMMIGKIILVMPISEKKRRAIEIYLRAIRRSGKYPSLQRLADFAQQHITKAYWKQYLQNISFLTLLIQKIDEEKESIKDKRLYNLYSDVKKEFSQTIEKKLVSHYLYMRANLLIDGTDNDEKNILSLINEDQIVNKYKFKSKYVISKVLNAKAPIMNSDDIMRVEDIFRITDTPQTQIPVDDIMNENNKTQKKEDKKLLKRKNRKIQKSKQQSSNTKNSNGELPKIVQSTIKLADTRIPVNVEIDKLIVLFEKMGGEWIDTETKFDAHFIAKEHFRFKTDSESKRETKNFNVGEHKIIWLKSERLLIYFLIYLIESKNAVFPSSHIGRFIETHFCHIDKETNYINSYKRKQISDQKRVILTEGLPIGSKELSKFIDSYL